jgi:hypothetical protein
MGFLDKLLGRAKTTAEETAGAAPEAPPSAPEPATEPAGDTAGQATDTVVELAERDDEDEPPADPARPGPAAA